MTNTRTETFYQADRQQFALLDFYSKVADQLNTRVFLWGALVQALVLELKDGHLTLLKGLAAKTTDNRLLRSALVEALVRFGEEDRERAETFILELIGQLTPPPKNFFEELARLRRPAEEEAESQVPPEKMIVVEAAMRLRLTKLLEDLAVEPSSRLRNLAAQNIFYLWKQDHGVGMQVLDSLSYRVRGKHGLPDLGAVESTMALIGAILGFEHKEQATLDSLSTIGRRALRRVLYLTDLDKTPTGFNRIRKAFQSVAYNIVTSVILSFALRIIGDFGEHSWASRKAMEHFFKLSIEQKELIRTFVPYLDYEEPGFETRVADMLIVQDWGDQIAQSIVEFSIIGRGVQDFDKTLGVVSQLTEYALSFKPPRFWTGGPLWNLWQSAVHLESPNPSESLKDQYMKLMDRVTNAHQENPALWMERARLDRPIPLSSDNHACNIANHMGAYYILTKRAEIPDVIHTYLDRAIQAEDDEYIVEYIREFVSLFELGYHHVAIAGIKPVANYMATHKNEKVQKALVDFLVRARNYDPEYIEDLLLRGEFPEEIANRVLANPTSERLADLLTYQLIAIVYDLFILGPKTLRNELKWLLAKAVDLSSFEEFVGLIIREIFNLVLGEVVFSVPPDAPSRQAAEKK